VAKLDSNHAWKEASGLVAANREVLFAIAGVFFMLPSLLVSIVVGEPAVDSAANSEQIMAAMLAFYGDNWWMVMLASLIQIVGILTVLTLMRDRRRPTVGEAIGSGFKGFPTYFAAQILFGFGAAVIGGLLVGAVAAVLPPLAVVLTLLLIVFIAFAALRIILVAPIVAVEGERNPVTALRRSWNLTSGNFWRILVFLALVTLLFLVAMAVIMILVGIVLALVSEGELQRVLASVVSSALTAVAVVYLLAMLAAIHRQLAEPARPNGAPA
jgi:hypothetical protein